MSPKPPDGAMYDNYHQAPISSAKNFAANAGHQIFSSENFTERQNGARFGVSDSNHNQSLNRHASNSTNDDDYHGGPKNAVYNAPLRSKLNNVKKEIQSELLTSPIFQKFRQLTSGPPASAEGELLDSRNRRRYITPAKPNGLERTSSTVYHHEPKPVELNRYGSEYSSMHRTPAQSGEFGRESQSQFGTFSRRYSNNGTGGNRAGRSDAGTQLWGANGVKRGVTDRSEEPANRIQNGIVKTRSEMNFRPNHLTHEQYQESEDDLRKLGAQFEQGHRDRASIAVIDATKFATGSRQPFQHNSNLRPLVEDGRYSSINENRSPGWFQRPRAHSEDLLSDKENVVDGGSVRRSVMHHSIDLEPGPPPIPARRVGLQNFVNTRQYSNGVPPGYPESFEHNNATSIPVIIENSGYVERGYQNDHFGPGRQYNGLGSRYSDQYAKEPAGLSQDPPPRFNESTEQQYPSRIYDDGGQNVAVVDAPLPARTIYPPKPARYGGRYGDLRNSYLSRSEGDLLDALNREDEMALHAAAAPKRTAHPGQLDSRNKIKPAATGTSKPTHNGFAAPKYVRVYSRSGDEYSDGDSTLSDTSDNSELYVHTDPVYPTVRRQWKYDFPSSRYPEVKTRNADRHIPVYHANDHRFVKNRDRHGTSFSPASRVFPSDSIRTTIDPPNHRSEKDEAVRNRERSNYRLPQPRLDNRKYASVTAGGTLPSRGSDRYRKPTKQLRARHANTIGHVEGRAISASNGRSSTLGRPRITTVDGPRGKGRDRAAPEHSVGATVLNPFKSFLARTTSMSEQNGSVVGRTQSVPIPEHRSRVIDGKGLAAITQSNRSSGTSGNWQGRSVESNKPTVPALSNGVIGSANRTSSSRQQNGSMTLTRNSSLPPVPYTSTQQQRKAPPYNSTIIVTNKPDISPNSGKSRPGILTNDKNGYSKNGAKDEHSFYDDSNGFSNGSYYNGLQNGSNSNSSDPESGGATMNGRKSLRKKVQFQDEVQHQQQKHQLQQNGRLGAPKELVHGWAPPNGLARDILKERQYKRPPLYYL